MKTTILPIVGILVAVGATLSVARTYPRREATNPPTQPPVSEFPDTVAAVGLVEASSENISVGSPLPGVVTRVYVAAGQKVRTGDPLFELDLRQERADLRMRRQELVVSQARVSVAAVRLADRKRQLEFAEQVTDKRAISAEELSARHFAVDAAAAELEQARAQVAAAEAQIHAVETEIERSTIRALVDAEVLQVKLRVGEFAVAGPTAAPMIVLGRARPLHVRVDVDEHEAWRVRPEASATGHLRGNAELTTPLGFVRFEPFVIPKRSLTGDSTERVDTRVLQVIYRVEREDLPLYIGQQLDVFIDGEAEHGGSR
jgi:multidrug efflux pump subunit AcrA (membrane-fusion protein)